MRIMPLRELTEDEVLNLLDPDTGK